MLLPLVLAILCSFTSLCEALMGDHVCAKIEKYSVPVTVSYAKPYKVRENYWCPKFPPRCTREKTELKTEYQVENITKTRVVNVCCKGYLQEDDTCVAFCTQGCQQGTCIAPDICKCHTDFYGPSCEKVYELVQFVPSSSTTTISTAVEDFSEVSLTLSTTPRWSPAISTTTTKPTSPSPLPTSVENTTPSDEMLKISSPASDEPALAKTSPSVLKNEEGHTHDLEAQPSDAFEVTLGTISSTEDPLGSFPTSPSITSETTPLFAKEIVTPEITEIIESSTETQPTPSNPLINFSQPLSPPTGGDPGSTSFAGTTGFTHSVIVLNNHSIHTSVATHPRHNQALHSFFEEHAFLLVVVGAALSLILGTVLAVLVCQQVVKNGKKKQNNSSQETVRHLPPLPTAISLEMPSTPIISFSACCESIDLQPAIYSMGTFKPSGHQPTISRELREALEATYDHPPSQSRSCHSSEGQRSLAEMWEAVMSASKEREVPQPAQVDEEHLYQEIPCYHPRLEIHDSRC
ncbi:uncharacterized protein LOC132203604 [Neocloeon triangulifer]|uniref:uncharacterized protein LOC132203604 n=1 Tax=Neocloeon triangulifer TaxID=2078957 RepID=UPI00286F4E99|nr:uncharacterized protein LOC132203604 [Neocloeon triangulifer]